jgi:hypothetical protein
LAPEHQNCMFRDNPDKLAVLAVNVRSPVLVQEEVYGVVPPLTAPKVQFRLYPPLQLASVLCWR